jgi:hypothetical protein
MNPIRCISVKTTILIGTDKESVCWDSFYRPDEMGEAEKYKHLQESIGGKPSKPWGEFKVEIIPLYAEPVLTALQPEAPIRMADWWSKVTDDAEQTVEYWRQAFLDMRDIFEEATKAPQPEASDRDIAWDVYCAFEFEADGELKDDSKAASIISTVRAEERRKADEEIKELKLNLKSMTFIAERADKEKTEYFEKLCELDLRLSSIRKKIVQFGSEDNGILIEGHTS